VGGTGTGATDQDPVKNVKPLPPPASEIPSTKGTVLICDPPSVMSKSQWEGRKFGPRTSTNPMATAPGSAEPKIRDPQEIMKDGGKNEGGWSGESRR
jgi:hypothetical protein